MNKDIQLTDGFVLLRPYQAEDVHALHAAALESMAALIPYMPWAYDEYSFPDSQQWVAGRSGDWDKGTSYDFVITDAGTGRYLGGCGLNGFDTSRRVANLGYWVRTSSTKKGVATAAARLLARLGIEELGLKRITIVVATPNKASQRVAEKAGAVREGVLRNAMLVREIIYDAVMFSIIPQDVGRSN